MFKIGDNNCIHFNYGMVIAISVYLACIASFQVTVDSKEAFNQCLFYSKLFFWFGVALLGVGAVGDLILDCLKVVFRPNRSIVRLLYPNDTTILFSYDIFQVGRKMKCLIYSFVVWTIFIRFLSNLAIAVTVPSIMLFNYINSVDCLFHIGDQPPDSSRNLQQNTPVLEDILIVEIVSLFILLILRVSTTASFHLLPRVPDVH